MKRWIQKAIEHPGALTEYVKRRFGRRGFTRKGTIKVSILRKLARDKKVSPTTRRRARLALTLRKLARRRRGRRRR